MAGLPEQAPTVARVATVATVAVATEPLACGLLRGPWALSAERRARSVPSAANYWRCQHPCLPLHSDLRDCARCWRSGLPLLAVCPCGHRRTVPFRLLKTSETDCTELYGRPFRCRACGSGEVALFDIGSQAELDEVQRSLAVPRQPAKAHSTHPRPDPPAWR